METHLPSNSRLQLIKTPKRRGRRSNKWIITFGLIACGGVIPLALIAGHVRGIPFPWRLIDCSFGVFGAIPLVPRKLLISGLEIRETPVKI
jgi:hypothetical protein